MAKSLITTAILALGVNAVAQQTTFTDGTFSPMDWTTYSFNAAGGTVTSQQTTDDGMPSPSLQVTIDRVNAPGEQVIGFSIDSAFLYNPEISGAIQSFEFQIDYRSLLAPGGGMAYGIAALQDGQFYAGGLGSADSLTWTHVGPVTTYGMDYWFGSQSQTQLNLNGGPIEFGFYCYASGGGASGPDTYFQTDWDNYSLTVSAAPESPTYLALLAGLLIFKTGGRKFGLRQR